MAFPVLIKALSKFLPPSQILVIQKHYKDQQVSVFFCLFPLQLSFEVISFHILIVAFLWI